MTKFLDEIKAAIVSGEYVLSEPYRKLIEQASETEDRRASISDKLDEILAILKELRENKKWTRHRSID